MPCQGKSHESPLQHILCFSFPTQGTSAPSYFSYSSSLISTLLPYSPLPSCNLVSPFALIACPLLLGVSPLTFPRLLPPPSIPFWLGSPGVCRYVRYTLVEVLLIYRPPMSLLAPPTPMLGAVRLYPTPSLSRSLCSPHPPSPHDPLTLPAAAPHPRLSCSRSSILQVGS